ncbi:Uncharacterised protein [Mycobacterium tuberculosis]|nr:Uncharacterised protein [Mycobacterium tuberculosis]
MLHAYSPVMMGTNRRSTDAENRIHRNTRCRVVEDARATSKKPMIKSPISSMVESFLRGLLFDLFKAEDAEVEFIVTGIERLVRPIFLARLKVLEVFADGYTIRGFA